MPTISFYVNDGEFIEHKKLSEENQSLIKKKLRDAFNRESKKLLKTEGGK